MNRQCAWLAGFIPLWACGVRDVHIHISLRNCGEMGTEYINTNELENFGDSIQSGSWGSTQSLHFLLRS